MKIILKNEKESLFNNESKKIWRNTKPKSHFHPKKEMQAGAYSDCCQTSKMELFTKIINC